MPIELELRSQYNPESRKTPEVIVSNQIKVEQGTLVLMVGPPGAGKSSFAEQHFPNESIVPTDGLRLDLSNNPNNQLVSKEAFDLAAKIINSRLQNGQTVVLDAMNLDSNFRQRFTKLAKENKSQVTAICLDTPEDELIRRDSQRMKRVGEEYLITRARRAKNEMVSIENDSNIDTIYKLNPALVNQVTVELSEVDRKNLSQDIEFAQDVKIAEINLLDYATSKILQGEKLDTETPRLTLEAGSLNFFPKNPNTIEFLKRNVLASQVIDLDWIVKRMGTKVNDPEIYHYATTLLRRRESLNLTTFVIFDEASAELAAKLFQEGKYSTLQDNLDESLLQNGVLEINRPGDEDTPLLILGDIHGSMTALRAHERNVFRENSGLLENQPKRRMLFVGDIADRGPYDAETIIFTTSLVRIREAVWVKGNHDVNLEKGLTIILNLAEIALKNGQTWEEFLSTLDIEYELQGKILSGATRNTIYKLLTTKNTNGETLPRLKLQSVKNILDVLAKAPTYKEYKHLVAVHGSLPRIPRENEEQSIETQKIHTHGKKLNGPNWTGRSEVMELPTVIAKDPEIFAVSGHTHKGAYINEISGVANLDFDGGSKGKVAAMYWMGPRHGEIVYEQEPSLLKLYNQLSQPELPQGEELIEFIKYAKDQGMIETKQGAKGSIYEGLTIINYSQITELRNLWEEYPSLRNFRGLIIDSEGNIVARPFKKTHKVGIEIPIEELSIVPDKVFEKANGSMGICYFYKGEWHIATKFSFDNEGYTQPAKKMLDELNTNSLDPNNTYLFEIILKNDAHIVDYGGQQKLILLNATNSKSGEELEWEEVERTANSLGVELVPDMTEQFKGMTIAQIFKFAQTPGKLVNMEGLMAQYRDTETGEKLTVKVKAIEYDKRKFVRDKLAWEKILEVFDWKNLDIAPDEKEALLSYNLDDIFIRTVLETRIDWIKKEYNDTISEIQEFVMAPWLEAQEIYDNVISSGGNPQQAVSKAMSFIHITITQMLESENNSQFSKSIRNSILGFIRGVLSGEPKAYENLKSIAQERIKQKIESEIQKRGKASYWVTPDDSISK